MRWLFLILFFASCCPKITETTETVTKRDTVISFRTDTVTLPGTTDTVTVEKTEICDSLLQELRIRNAGSTLTISRENDRLNFVIECDSLQGIIDSIQQLQITDTIRITDTKVVTKFKRKGKWWIWLLVGAVGGLMVSIFIRR